MLKGSVLKSVFKRHGEEGLFTRLVTSATQLAAVLALYKIVLLENEEALIWYQEENDYLMITDKRVIFRNNFNNKEDIIIALTQLKEANYVISEQPVVTFGKFTMLAITDIAGNRYLLKTEAPPVFNGIYQLLHTAICTT